jgi:hypothetical protein
VHGQSLKNFKLLRLTDADMRRCRMYESGNRHSPSSRRPRRSALRLQIAHGKNCVRCIQICCSSGTPETGAAGEIIKRTNRHPLTEMPIGSSPLSPLHTIAIVAQRECQTSKLQLPPIVKDFVQAGISAGTRRPGSTRRIRQRALVAFLLSSLSLTLVGRASRVFSARPLAAP